MNKTQNKILLMDEELWSVQSVIDRIKYEFGDDIVDYCSDGSEGVQYLNKKCYKCIILDIMFPLGEDEGLNRGYDTSNTFKGGLFVLDYIRSTLKIETPVICFTMRTDDQVKEEIQQYANTTHIGKLDSKAFEILIGTVDKYLKHDS